MHSPNTKKHSTDQKNNYSNLNQRAVETKRPEVENFRPCEFALFSKSV
jgi:hypothetical protein